MSNTCTGGVVCLVHEHTEYIHLYVHVLFCVYCSKELPGRRSLLHFIVTWLTMLGYPIQGLIGSLSELCFVWLL